MTKLLVIVYLWLHISHSYLLQSNRYHKWDKNVQSIVSYSRLNLIYKREICKSTNTQLNASNADADKEMIPSNLVVQIVRSLSEVDRDVWNQFSDSKTSPFLDYDWLYILEQSGCVVANKGWDPVHLLVTSAPDTNSSIFRNESTGKISVAITSATNVLAACPLYVKYHSAGEFIFDQEWAQFAESRLRLPYYPKVSLVLDITLWQLFIMSCTNWFTYLITHFQLHHMYIASIVGSIYSWHWCSYIATSNTIRLTQGTVFSDDNRGDERSGME